MEMKQKLSMLLALVLVLTMIPISASAETEGNSPFTDVSSNHWALQHIFKMERRGVITGYGNGIFQPDRTVTQLEAVVMAVRAMGLEDEAKKMNTSAVDAWHLSLPASWNASAYVAMAIEKDLIDQENFVPDQNASRSWIAVLMIKMIGAEDEVIQTSNTDFYDDYYILPQAKGYVALAAEKGMITGYYDSKGNLKFDPNVSVTRAQLAAMISRSDAYMPDVNGQLPLAKITAVNGQQITVMDQNSLSATYSLSNQALIFDLQGKKSSQSGLQTGLVIRYALNSVQLIDYIEFVNEEQWQESQAQIKGTIVEIYTDDLLLTIKDENGKLTIYPYSETVVISNQTTSQLQIADLRIGDEISATLNSSNTIINIVITSAGLTGKITGSIYSLNLDSNMITVKYNGQYGVYTLADQVYVEYQGVRFPAVSDLKQGDEVELTVENDQVTRIKVIQPFEQETLKGTIITLSNSTQVITVRLESGTLKAYDISDDAEITIRGLDLAALDDLKIDDLIQFTVENGIITSLEVTNREITNEVTGVIKSIDTVNQYLIIENDAGELKTFPFDSYVKVDLDDDIRDLEIDMRVTLLLQDNVIYAVTTNSAVQGTFVEIDKYETFITIINDQNKRVIYRLDDDVDVDMEDVSSPDLSDLEAGQTISLELDDEIVTDIDVEVKKTYILTDINTTKNRITVEEDDDEETYTLSSYTTITISGISKPKIEDLVEGDMVRLTFTGNSLTDIEAISPAYGTVKSVEAYRKYLVVTTASGDQTVDLNKTLTIYNSQGTKMSLDKLQVNDYLKIIELESEIIITQAEKVNGQLVTVDTAKGKIYIKDQQGVYHFYELAESVKIWKGTTVYYLGDLQTDDNLTLYLFNDLIFSIMVN